MRILITAAASPLSRALAAELAEAGHELSLVDTEHVAGPERSRSFAADLTDTDALWPALRLVDAVIHTGQLPAQVPAAGYERDAFLLDYYTRGTHALFRTAVEAGARRFVYGSTLDLFRPYADDVYITEMWRPLPTPDMEPMARYLGELTCREFAREHLITVTALRLGSLAREEDVVGSTPDPMWLDERDAVRAFAAAVQRDASGRANWSQRWSLMHLCARPANPRYLCERAAGLAAPAHHFAAAWKAAAAPGQRPAPEAVAPARRASGARRVLFLGASGNIGPFLTPGLRDHYDLTLTDVQPHPDGTAVETVDVTDYGQVLEAARGVDAIVNFTVVRGDPDLSFHVSTKGAWHVMKAAAELGIGKVLHSGPEYVRPWYDHDFDIDNPPNAPGAGFYGLTKMLSREICRIYARTYGIVTPCLLFNGLQAAPTAPVREKDFAPFTIVWEDLQHACRLGLEVESLPDHYEEFNLHSHLGQGKFSIERARRLLGYEPTQDWTRFYRRPTA